MKLLKTALALGSIFGAREAAKALQHVDVDQVLATIGLERKPRAYERTLPVVGLITLGAAIGAGAALLLAPSSGRELRARISGRIDETRHQLSERLREFERQQRAEQRG
jgi:hypothetical protein